MEAVAEFFCSFSIRHAPQSRVFRTVRPLFVAEPNTGFVRGENADNKTSAARRTLLWAKSATLTAVALLRSRDNPEPFSANEQLKTSMHKRLT